MRRTPPRIGGEEPLPGDDTRTHEPLATGGTPLGMALPTLRTHRLPVQTPGDLQGRLPKRRAAGGEGRGVAWMVQPVSPHHARLGHRDMEEPPLAERPPRARSSVGERRTPRRPPPAVRER